MNDEQSHRETRDGAAEGGSARYGKAAGARGSGHQESRKPEKKEERGFVSRQGGSQNRDDGGGGAGDESGDTDREERAGS